MRKIPPVLGLVLLILCLPILAACSDDDDEPTGATGASAAAAASSTSATTQANADAAVQGTVSVDFTGAPEEKDRLEVPFEVAPGSTAWEAIKDAIGEGNLTFRDFGGDLGIFISGFNGVAAEGNHFWEFKVNGQGAEAGVSKYEVQQGDMLEFVYSSF